MSDSLDFYIKVGQQAVGPFSEMELREAALANVIATDASVSRAADGPWESATEAGFYSEKGMALPHAAGVNVPECQVLGMPGSFHGPFKLRELIGFAARGMLPADSPVQFVGSDSALSKTFPGVTIVPSEVKPAITSGDWNAASSLRILDETLSGRLLRVQPSGRLVLLTAATPKNIPDDARNPIDVAPKAVVIDPTALVDRNQPDQLDPEYQAEVEKQKRIQAEEARLRRESEQNEKAAAKVVAEKAAAKAEAESRKSRARAKRDSASEPTPEADSRRSSLVVLGILAVIAAGVFLFKFSNREPIVEVSGVLTHQGNPVPGMMITFKPAQGRPSWGMTDDAGNFTLKYSRTIPNGALIAKHRVWLTRGSDPSVELSPEEYLEQMMAEPSSDEGGIPNKYFAEKSSDISINITRATHALAIELPWQP